MNHPDKRERERQWRFEVSGEWGSDESGRKRQNESTQPSGRGRQTGRGRVKVGEEQREEGTDVEGK